MRQLQEIDEKYYQELRDYFWATSPQQTAGQDDEMLLEIITASIKARARELNIGIDDALLRFAGIAVLINPRFYDAPKVRELFALEGIEPNYKVHTLSEQFIYAFHDRFEES